MASGWLRTALMVESVAVCMAFSACSLAEDTPQAPSASRLYLAAYESMTMAEWLGNQGLLAESADLYNEALRFLRQINADFPQWHTNVVSFRMQYCMGELAKSKTVSPERPAFLAEDRALPVEPAVTNRSAVVTLPPKTAMPLTTDRFKVAFRLEQESNARSALAVYRQILAGQPQNQKAIKGAVRCYLHLDAFDEARKLIKKGIASPAADAELNLLQALILCHDREYAKAIPLLNAAIKETPQNAAAHLALGVAFMAGGKLDNARAEMKRALEIDSMLGEAYYNLARLSLAAKPPNAEDAMRYYRNALQFGAEPDPTLAKLFK